MLHDKAPCRKTKNKNLLIQLEGKLPTERPTVNKLLLSMLLQRFFLYV